jgi:flagellar FliL protein
MAEQELEIEEGGKKSKLIIIIAAVAIVLLVAAGAGYYFLMAGDDTGVPIGDGESALQAPQDAVAAVKIGTALYVAMPRPFVFNVPGSSKDRLVEIKVQLMIRGSNNQEQARMHIPLIEGTLLKTFSTANADELATEAGKIAIRSSALKEVQNTMLDISGNKTVEEVLFTGFVMQ